MAKRYSSIPTPPKKQPMGSGTTVGDDSSDNAPNPGRVERPARTPTDQLSRRPTLRDSINRPPKPSARDRINQRRGSQDRNSGSGAVGEDVASPHRPMVQGFLDRLHSMRESQRKRLFGGGQREATRPGITPGGTHQGRAVQQPGKPAGDQTPKDSQSSSGSQKPNKPTRDRPNSKRHAPVSNPGPGEFTGSNRFKR